MAKDFGEGISKKAQSLIFYHGCYVALLGHSVRFRRYRESRIAFCSSFSFTLRTGAKNSGTLPRVADPIRSGKTDKLWKTPTGAQLAVYLVSEDIHRRGYLRNQLLISDVFLQTLHDL